MNYYVRCLIGAITLMLCSFSPITSYAPEREFDKVKAAKTLYDIVWTNGNRVLTGDRPNKHLEASMELTMGNETVIIRASEKGDMCVILRRITKVTDNFYCAEIYDNSLRGFVDCAEVVNGEWKSEQFAQCYDTRTGGGNFQVGRFWQQKYMDTLYYCVTTLKPTGPSEKIIADAVQKTAR